MSMQDLDNFDEIDDDGITFRDNNEINLDIVNSNINEKEQYNLNIQNDTNLYYKHLESQQASFQDNDNIINGNNMEINFQRNKENILQSESQNKKLFHKSNTNEFNNLSSPKNKNNRTNSMTNRTNLMTNRSSMLGVNKGFGSINTNENNTETNFKGRNSFSANPTMISSIKNAIASKVQNSGLAFFNDIIKDPYLNNDQPILRYPDPPEKTYTRKECLLQKYSRKIERWNDIKALFNPTEDYSYNNLIRIKYGDIKYFFVVDESFNIKISAYVSNKRAYLSSQTQFNNFNIKNRKNIVLNSPLVFEESQILYTMEQDIHGYFNAYKNFTYKIYHNNKSKVCSKNYKIVQEMISIKKEFFKNSGYLNYRSIFVHEINRSVISIIKYKKYLSYSYLLELKINNYNEVMTLYNKEPSFNPQTKNYSIKSNRIKLASVKNFVFYNYFEKMLVFGKVSEDNYVLDFDHPYNYLNATCMALTTFFKL